MLTACSHERPLFDLTTKNRVIEACHDFLLPHAREFDAFAITGYSMALISPILAYMMRKETVIVRPEGLLRNSSYDVEGKHGQRCVMVDDLIASGRTVRYLHGSIHKIDCQLVGVVCWYSLYRDKGDIEEELGIKIQIFGLPEPLSFPVT